MVTKVIESIDPEAGIYPKRRNPYYFVVPRFTKQSAGIKAIYILCHWLNMLGESAFIYTWPPNVEKTVNPECLAPPATKEIVEFHQRNGYEPIVVYTDSAEENVANAEIVVRYFGHYPGHLHPYVRMTDDELHFSHSKLIASRTDNPENVLFIPSCDLRLFRPPEVPVPRKGTCYYAAKFKEVHGQEVFDIPSDCFEITRGRKDSLTQEQLVALFHRMELLYCFEDSAIANEAAMCGCPVVLVPNRFFTESLAIEEVGWDGYAWGNDPAEVDRARATVGKSRANYIALVQGFAEQVISFRDKTRAFAAERHQTGRLFSPDDAISRSTDLPFNLKRSKVKRVIENLPLIGPHYRRVRRLKERLNTLTVELNAVKAERYELLRLVFEFLKKVPDSPNKIR